MKATIHLVCVFFLFIFSLLFLPISDASDNVSLPSLPNIPSAPKVISNGSVYFVNKNIGRDSFTLEDAKNRLKPWATIQRGVSALRAGDTLVVSGSRTPYEEQVKIDIAGSERRWIAIKGADGEAPVLEGFILEENTAFIKLSNFRLVPKAVGIYLKRGVKNFYIEDVEIDGQDKARWGIQLGADIVDENGVKFGYIKNTTVHHTVKYGVYIENGAENIVFDGVVSRNSLMEDGFAGRSNPSEYPSLTKNLFFINSVAHDNAGDGFDIGSGDMQVFQGCVSYNNGGRQGVGFKVWGGIDKGGEIWLINNLAYNNAFPALVIKNISDANVYIFHNTFVENDTSGRGVEIMTVDYNPDSGWFRMGVPRLFMYNNIISSKGKGPILTFYNERTKIVESDCNYIVSSQKASFCQVRHDRKEVIYELLMKELGSSKDKSRKMGCGYLNEDLDIHSYIQVKDAKNDPGFFDREHNNFSLSQFSPAINKGCQIGITEDIHKRPRAKAAPDIGAFEYVPAKSH